MRHRRDWKRWRTASGWLLGGLLLGLLAVGLAACSGQSSGQADRPDDVTRTAAETQATSQAGASDVQEDAPDALDEPVGASTVAAADETPVDEATGDRQGEDDAAQGTQEASVSLPFLIDLGANKCIPCKLMAPILEDLAETKSDYFEVIFYDVWENRSKGQEFGIRAIPTQIFFSAQGEELFRHEGYFSRNQILDKWRELGVDVGE